MMFGTLSSMFIPISSDSASGISEDAAKSSSYRKSPCTTAKSVDSSVSGSIDGMYRYAPVSEPYERVSVGSDEKRMISCQASSSVSSAIHHQHDDCGDNDEFGWFDFSHEQDQSSSEEIRSAWMKAISTVSNVKLEVPMLILHEWHNPRPSMSMKLSTSDLTKAQGYGVNSSSCVSGMRICQYPTGEIRAEFHFVFCYGSMSYMSWKPYREFKKLAIIILTLHRDSNPLFHQTLRVWKFLAERTRWFRSFDVQYLIRKSILLGRFMEALLHEVPSPGLILAFTQSDRLQSLPSW